MAAAPLTSSLGPSNSWFSLYERHTDESDRLLEEQLGVELSGQDLAQEERRIASGLRHLMELRRLIHPKGGRGKRALREAFLFTQAGRRAEDREIALFLEKPVFHELSLPDISQCALQVSSLYWKLYDLCLSPSASVAQAPLANAAQQLFGVLFGRPFEPRSARVEIERVTDEMLKEQGVPFLILNLIRRGQTDAARHVGRALMQFEEFLDEDRRSAYYWLAELAWFTDEAHAPLTDHESTLRSLYHLCFTNPDRGGFLEIDSPFFSEFVAINEMAQEGFLFKESLIDKFLEVWQEHTGMFDSLFCQTLQKVTGNHNKILDDIQMWQKYWERESEEFGKEFLFVVEGNLSYAKGNYADAALYYEKAIKLQPEIRSARLNLLFAYARLGVGQQHGTLVEKLMEDGRLRPAVLYNVANSYLLLGKEGHADVYYADLKGQEGWEFKTEFYRSTFCLEHGLVEMALRYAQAALCLNSQDTSVKYHLALCLAAHGQKQDALQLVQTFREVPDWMSYYRFTLERDTGNWDAALHTLRDLPTDYFQDPDELDEALEFARKRQDLALLRQLRNLPQERKG